MKLWHIKKGSIVHSLLYGAVSFNSHAYTPTFSEDGNPLLSRFSGNRMNFCEGVRHLLIWAPLYFLVHVLLFAIPIYAIVAYPFIAGTTASFVYYAIATGAVAALIAVAFLLSVLTSWSEAMKEKARTARLDSMEKAIEVGENPTPKKTTNYMDVLSKAFLVTLKFVGKCLTLFGLIPAIFKLATMVYTMFKENYCPILTIEDEETVTEGEA